jgi:hypothetical protein
VELIYYDFVHRRPKRKVNEEKSFGRRLVFCLSMQEVVYQIYPTAQSAIGEQQWVTGFHCVCAVQCCRMVDSVPIRHTISIL